MPSTLAQVVDQQLDAYNQRDIDAFSATYAEDVEIYDFPDQLRYRGVDELSQRYGKKFAEVTRLHAQSLSRMQMGNILIDHELARWSNQTEGEFEHQVEVLVIYQVDEGKITKVWFKNP